MSTVILQRGRALTRYAEAECLVRSSRSFSYSANLSGATGRPPTPVTSQSGGGTVISPQQTNYLGYLSNVLGSFSFIPKANPFVSRSDQQLETEASGNTKVVTRAVSSERVIVKKTSRSEVTGYTKVLLKKLLYAETNQSKILRIQELSAHLIAFPPTRIVAVHDGRLIQYLLDVVRKNESSKLKGEANQCLSLCGYVPCVKGRGVNLLSIDGGGTRGMMGLEVLEALEAKTGKKICELFDHVVGVSTGAIIATMLGTQKRSVKETREVYMEISGQLFSQGRFSGVSGLIMSHSYYNTAKWVKILKEILGDQETLISTSGDPEVPKLSVISCIVNLPHLQPYVFRNYEPPAGRDSHYRGSTGHKIWEAIQASAAAPGYFAEVQLGNVLHQDGGVFANNPTSIAVHETKLLWPEEEIHCLVSVGNGRTVQDLEPAPTMQSTKVHHKLSKIIDSATDTEGVHMSMHDLLSDHVYYRFNPYMTYPYGLDEISPERLDQMQHDSRLYVRRNSKKIERAAKRLLQKPTLLQIGRRSYNEWKCRNGRYTPQ